MRAMKGEGSTGQASNTELPVKSKATQSQLKSEILFTVSVLLSSNLEVYIHQNYFAVKLFGNAQMMM